MLRETKNNRKNKKKKQNEKYIQLNILNKRRTTKKIRNRHDNSCLRSVIHILLCFFLASIEIGNIQFVFNATLPNNLSYFHSAMWKFWLVFNSVLTFWQLEIYSLFYY